MSEVLIRDAFSTDEPFILKSWSTSSSEFATEAFDLQVTDHNVISQLISAAASGGIAKKYHSSRIRLVACEPSDPDSIFGFIVGDPGPIAHFCFVKYAARRMKVGTALFEQFLVRAEAPPGSPVRCSHWGFQAANLAPRLGLIYDPMAKVKRNHT